LKIIQFFIAKFESRLPVFNLALNTFTIMMANLCVNVNEKQDVDYLVFQKGSYKMKNGFIMTTKTPLFLTEVTF
jgi:hypothetical protein